MPSARRPRARKKTPAPPPRAGTRAPRPRSPPGSAPLPSPARGRSGLAPRPRPARPVPALPRPHPAPSSAPPRLTSELLQKALTHAFDHIVITDTEGTILFANPAVRRTTGYPAREVVGNNPRLWRGPNTPSAYYRRMWRTIKREKRTFHGFIQNRRRNGELYDAEVVLSPFLDSRGRVGGFFGIERDISHQVATDWALSQAQSALARSEANFRELVAKLPDIVLVYDPDGRVRYANPATYPVAGFTPQEVVGRKLSDFIPPAERRRIQRLFRQYEADPAQGAFVCPILAADGSTRHISAQVADILYEGIPSKLMVVSDVSILRQAMDSARRSLSLQQATFEASLDGLLVTDLSMRITSYNEAFERLARLPPAVLQSGDGRQALSMMARLFTPTSDAYATMQRIMGDPSAQGPLSGRMDSVVELTDGRVFTWSSQPQRVGDAIVGRVWVFHELTELYLAQRELRKAKSFLDTILDHVPVSLVVKEASSGRFLLFNKMAERITGIPASKALGKTDSDFFPKDQADRLGQADAQVLASARVLSSEHVLDTPSGRRLLRDTKVPIPGPEGRPGYLLVAVEDLTERRELEQALRSSEERYKTQLEEEVRLKTRQLTEANRRLMALERTKNRFLLDLGHELKTPLAVIQMNLTSLQTDLRPEQRKICHEMIRRNIHRLNDHVEEVIQLTKFEADAELSRTPFDLSDLLGRLVGENQDFARVKSIDLTYRAPPAPLMVEADQRLLSFAATSLLSNAIKFSPNGGRVEVHLVQSEDRALVSVSDTGDGVSPEAEARLFKKYFKGDPIGPGTGVGLFMAMEIVRAHGGELWYEPNRPRGARFSIALPLSLKTPPSQVAP